jgi:V/A-type H+/Na+-transporting ATPase subunit E
MNAEQVVEKILSQAKAEAAAIVADAQDKVAAQRSALEAELAEFDTKTTELADRAAEDKLQRMLAGARMSNAKRLLAARVGLIDEIFAQARQAVNQLPDEAYLSLMMTLMKQAVETGDEEVIVGKRETRITPDFIKRVNRELGTGFKGNLRRAETKADIGGGFMLARGKVRINAATEVLIERLRESMEIELSRELFSN